MRKIFYLFLAAIACVRCDVMDTEPLNDFSSEVIWGDKVMAQGFIYNSYGHIMWNFMTTPTEGKIANTYTNIGGKANGGQAGFASDMHADNVVMGEFSAPFNKDIYSSNQDAGWDVFDLIRQTNVIINEATNCPLDEVDKANFVAQGKFLRGMVYLRHARMFGGAILLDKPLTTSDQLILPRNTIKETYDFIIKDFLDAAEVLSEKLSAAHANKATAYGFASEAALQAASYVGDDSYYEIALDAAKKAIDYSGATLDPEYYNIFNNFGNGLANSEIMFGYFADNTKTKYQQTLSMRVGMRMDAGKQVDGVTPAKCSSTYISWGAGFVTQDMIDAYEVIDPADGKAKSLYEASFYKDFQRGVGDASEMLSANRDKRYYASIVYDGSEFGRDRQIVHTRVMGNVHYASNPTTPENRKNGTYGIRKSIHDVDCAPAWNGSCDYHYVLFRLGRAYLNYAEALLRTGDTATALEYVNKTRTVHGGLPALETNLSADDAWMAYTKERRVELFYENNDRYWSLLRWAKKGDAYSADALRCLGKDLNPTNVITADGKDWTTEPKFWEPVMVDAATHVWSSRKFFFPIPQDEITKSGGVIEQNPGW